ncbi:MAG: CinA family nicotinamide mononucleotide deamidase-related protein [Proteobacteria bacterium]|nr:CinA family nicotinamide mononucleotide deamidase-related protein [Pseudomonadota bacterium]
MNFFSIETLAVGDELLTGKIADTNSAYVGQVLFENGFRLSRQNVIPDEKKSIQSSIQEISKRAKAAICFGGLGPTSDDITAACVSELLGVPLEVNEAAKTRLIEYLSARKRQVTEQTLKQVAIPRTVEVIPNYAGLAPGFSFSYQGCHFFFLPGVPDEMKPMFSASVLPKLVSLAPPQGQVESFLWRCIGIVESELQRLMVSIEKKLPEGMWLGYRTRFPENYLYLYCMEENENLRTQKIDEWKSQIEPLVAPYCYGNAEKDLEEWVFDLLKKRKMKIALAESCTGGLVVQRLTRVPGASDWVWGGFVSYQIDAKEKMLGVKLKQPSDAVSPECTLALAKNALSKSGCDVALAVTGYMGPTGGTESGPVGTVFIAVTDREGKTIQDKIELPPRPRATLQWGASSFSLNTLRKLLK